MNSEDPTLKIQQLEKAIAAQENLRGTVDDAVIEATIDALRHQIDELSQEANPAEQRKLATILFVDVADSTQLLLDVDPEDHMAVMDNALRQLAEPVVEHGGKINRFMGDGYLAVFGLPRAKENDPEMAVRAGLAVLEKSHTIARNLEDERGLKNFQVRVGINTGFVMAGGYTEAENTIMGTAVNLAKRVEDAAPPGGLLVSHDTYQQVRGLFNFEKAESIQMKGFDEPVQVYLVRGAMPHTFRASTRGIEGIETPLIGREKELTDLQNTFSTIENNPDSPFITIMGEAGMGKSRLLQEFENWLSQGGFNVALFKGRATLDTLELPYGLLRDLFASQFEIMDDDSLSTVRKKVADNFSPYAQELGIFEQAAHFVGHMLGYDFSNSPYVQSMLDTPRQLHDQGLNYLVQYFKAVSQDKSVAIFLDDIHWADESTLDTFIYLHEQLAGQPVMMIALSRPSLLEKRPTWGDMVAHQRIDLLPLSTLQCQQLVGEVLYKVENIPSSLSNLIIKNAEGNPYYLEELIKMLMEDGVISTDDPVWQIESERLNDIRIPATLTGVLQARLDSLPPDERTALQQASVIGRTFWEAAVSYLSAENGQDIKHLPAPDEIIRSLSRLEHREMISENKTSTFSNTKEYAFQHTLLLDVTYESVLRKKRQSYHALIADWLIEQRKERSGELSGLIATHLEKAGKKLEALEYFHQAAESANLNYAIDEAVEFYRHALSLVPETDLDKKYSILLGSEKALSLKGNIELQQTMLDQLIQTADLLDDDRKRAEVQLRKAWFAFFTSNSQDMIRSADKALGFLSSTKNHQLEWEVYYALGWAYMLQDNLDVALEHAESALKLARLIQSKRCEANTLNILGSIKSKQGELLQSYEYMNGALKLVREMNDQERVLTAQINLSATLVAMGKLKTAQELLEQSLKIGREKGDIHVLTTALINLAWATSAQGMWQPSVEYVEEGLVLMRKQEHIEAVAEGLHWLGNALLGLGKPEKAIEAFGESIAIRKEIQLPHLEIESTAGLAKAKLDLGDLTGAKAVVDQILSYLDQGNSLQKTWEPVLVYWRCIQVLEAVGNPRSEDLINEAFQILTAQANKLPEGEYRQNYLTNLPGHQEIMRRWEEISKA